MKFPRITNKEKFTKNRHTVRTVPISNRKIFVIEATSIPLTNIYMYMTAHSRSTSLHFGTYTSVKNGCVKFKINSSITAKV